MNFVPGSTSDDRLFELLNLPVGTSRRRACRISFPNGVTWSFNAELTGYDTTVNAGRCAAIARRIRELFPALGGVTTVDNWAGLRPATPNNVPVIGRTRLRNLYLNTGHGTLGWTLACGSGSVLADLISGRRPQVDFPFT